MATLVDVMMLPRISWKAPDVYYDTHLPLRKKQAASSRTTGLEYATQHLIVILQIRFEYHREVRVICSKRGVIFGGEVRGRQIKAENISQSGSTDQRGDPANS